MLNYEEMWKVLTLLSMITLLIYLLYNKQLNFLYKSWVISFVWIDITYYVLSFVHLIILRTSISTTLNLGIICDILYRTTFFFDDVNVFLHLIFTVSLHKMEFFGRKISIVTVASVSSVCAIIPVVLDFVNIVADLKAIQGFVGCTYLSYNYYLWVFHKTVLIWVFLTIFLALRALFDRRHIPISDKLNLDKDKVAITYVIVKYLLVLPHVLIMVFNFHEITDMYNAVTYHFALMPSFLSSIATFFIIGKYKKSMETEEPTGDNIVFEENDDCINL